MASGLVDYDLGGLYFPPVGSLRRDKYQEVCTDIVKWFDKHLAKLPQRSVPLFAVDFEPRRTKPKRGKSRPNSRRTTRHGKKQKRRTTATHASHEGTRTLLPEHVPRQHGHVLRRLEQPKQNRFLNWTVQHVAVLQEDACERKNRKKTSVHQFQSEKRPLPKL